MATLLDGRQHRVTGHGTLTVGEAADADILRHPEANPLSRIEDADGRIIVDGKEPVRPVLQSQNLRSQCLGIGTVVTDTDNLLIHFQTMFQQRILITIKTVFRYLELHRTTIVGDTLTARLYQMGHGIIGSHVIIDHHTTGVDTRTDTVVEHDGDAGINQFLIVLIVLGILRL